MSVKCERNLSICAQLSQSIGLLRCFDVQSSTVFDVKKRPPVYSNNVDLFKIFPGPSQILGSLLLVWLQSFGSAKEKTFAKEKIRAGRKQNEKDDDSLTTLENSADGFNLSVDVWKGSLKTLREQLVE